MMMIQAFSHFYDIKLENYLDLKRVYQALETYVRMVCQKEG